MLLCVSVGVPCAGLVQEAEGALLLPGVQEAPAVAVASSVINRVTGPHSALTSSEPVYLDFAPLGLNSCSCIWGSKYVRSWLLCRVSLSVQQALVHFGCCFSDDKRLVKHDTACQLLILC